MPFFKAVDIYSKCGSSNPYDICDFLGIHIIKYDLPLNIQGFFQCIYEEFVIFVNSNISEELFTPVIFHELGHILMHSHLNTIFLEEHTEFVVQRFENEADLFSATLIMLDLEEDTYIYDLCNLSFFSYEIIEKVVKFKQENLGSYIAL